jgi:hypothetical protein
MDGDQMDAVASGGGGSGEEGAERSGAKDSEQRDRVDAVTSGGLLESSGPRDEWMGTKWTPLPAGGGGAGKKGTHERGIDGQRVWKGKGVRRSRG